MQLDKRFKDHFYCLFGEEVGGGEENFPLRSKSKLDFI